MSSATVPFGPFVFCTLQQLNQARIAFTAQASSFNSGLIGASINGQSYQFTAPDGLTYSREEYGAHLHAAYLSLGITDYGEPSPSRTVARLA